MNKEAYSASANANEAIRPFHIYVPHAALLDLRRRINATRWPERETVTDDTQGDPLKTIQELASYWGQEYDWRKVQARLSAFPQFMTEIDALGHPFRPPASNSATLTCGSSERRPATVHPPEPPPTTT